MSDDMQSLGSRFRLDDLIEGLAGDLQALREGRISVQDARARAELAKQMLRGVQFVVTARKFLADNAKAIPSGEAE